MRSTGRQLRVTETAAPAASPACAEFCIACGAVTQHAFRFRVNDCTISQCVSCGIGRTEAASFDPQAYYTDAYFCGGRRDGYAGYLAAAPVLRREFRNAVRFVRQHRPSGRLLELGCAYGFFPQEAQPYFEVAGIELAQDAAEHCRRAGLNVLSGTAEENLGAVGKRDVIAAFDVIEHLPDPATTLALLARQLEPGGIVVLTTGDFGAPLARLMGARWRLMTPPQHLWFFTVESLRRLAAGAGLALTHLDRPWKIVPLSLASFQLRRMLGLEPAPVVASRIGLPVNLFDAIRVVLRKPGGK